MRFDIRLGLLMLAVSATAVGQESNPNTKLPINLVADNGEYDAVKGVATYTGNVIITQGEMNLTGDKVVIHLKEGEVETIESWGNLATFHYVPVDEPPIDGEGEYMIYKIATSTIDIDKQAYVKQQDNDTSGEHLTYYLDEDLVRGTRVHMTLQPKS